MVFASARSLLATVPGVISVIRRKTIALVSLSMSVVSQHCACVQSLSCGEHLQCGLGINFSLATVHENGPHL